MCNSACAVTLGLRAGARINRNGLRLVALYQRAIRAMTFGDIRQGAETRMIRSILLALYALACVFSVHVSKPPVRPPIDASAYALPDGSLPPICSPANKDGHVGAYSDACGLCCLAKLSGLQPPSARDLVPAASAGERLAITNVAFREPAQRFAALGARGPPMI